MLRKILRYLDKELQKDIADKLDNVDWQTWKKGAQRTVYTEYDEMLLSLGTKACEGNFEQISTFVLPHFSAESLRNKMKNQRARKKELHEAILAADGSEAPACSSNSFVDYKALADIGKRHSVGVSKYGRRVLPAWASIKDICRFLSTKRKVGPWLNGAFSTSTNTDLDPIVAPKASFPEVNQYKDTNELYQKNFDPQNNPDTNAISSVDMEKGQDNLANSVKLPSSCMIDFSSPLAPQLGNDFVFNTVMPSISPSVDDIIKRQPCEVPFESPVEVFDCVSKSIQKNSVLHNDKIAIGDHIVGSSPHCEGKKGLPVHSSSLLGINFLQDRIN